VRPFVLAVVSAAGALWAASTAAAQAPGPASGSEHADHAAIEHGAAEGAGEHAGHGGEHGQDAPSAPFGEGSGTARLPGTEGAMQGLHHTSGNWMLMTHGYVTAQYTDMSGPRGDDKLYSTSMAMFSATRRAGWGRIRFNSMLSLEPLMSERGYPSLFSTGETAGGAALVDRQHPHDLFMELAARIDVNVAAGTTAFLYAGPVGEPALGPSSFMHRGSATDNPDPPIAHHWFDSTHITYGVITAGLSSRLWQLEASAFRGGEPDEDRWDIEAPRLDSWSVRGTFNPDRHWALQASYGELDEPEALHPGQDERRFTASTHYTNGPLSATLAFSAKDRVPGSTLTAWVGEARWKLGGRGSVFGRVENVDNAELFPDHDDPLHDVAFRVTKVQLGYARHIPVTSTFSLTLGASGAVYAKPGALDAAYGDDPFGYTLFARFNIGH
jgi:hypothetical protein